MGLLRIHCHSCGGTWEVYGRDNWKEDNSRTCPYCHEKIDGQDWNKQILPAFGAMMDANRELMKTHSGYDASLFAVDYIADPLPDTSSRATEAAFKTVETRLDGLREAMEVLTESIGTMAAVMIQNMKEGEEDL